MMNVSSVETATPVRSFHHDSAINVNVDTDALNGPLTTCLLYTSDAADE